MSEAKPVPDATATLTALLAERVLVLDGAMGNHDPATRLQ
jgi:methionine synthase I (cobalamin-dependent)